MKTFKKKIVIFFIFFIFSFSQINFASAQQAYVNFQVFYNELSPYGQWVNYQHHGYVWMPAAGPDFAPYSTNGYWIMTEYGMTWYSDYSWGWAPFHYGRWDYDNYYGWFWIPDNEWGPAWVNWRDADDYYGWEPMQPGISINVSFNNRPDYHSNRWIFVRHRDIDRTNIHRYYVKSWDHDRIYRSSTVINNTYIDNSHTTYISGPNRNDMQRNMGRKMRTVSIQENASAGQSMRNNQLNIYRPKFNDNKQGREIIPNKITEIKDVKNISTRNTLNQYQSNQNRSTKQQEIDNKKNTNINEDNKRKQENIQNENNRRIQQQDNDNKKNTNINEDNKRKQENIQNENNRRIQQQENDNKKNIKVNEDNKRKQSNQTNDNKQNQSQRNNKSENKRGR